MAGVNDVVAPPQATGVMVEAEPGEEDLGIHVAINWHRDSMQSEVQHRVEYTVPCQHDARATLDFRRALENLITHAGGTDGFGSAVFTGIVDGQKRQTRVCLDDFKFALD